MSWTYTTKQLSSNAFKYHIFEAEEIMSFQKIFSLWRDEDAFRTFYNEMLSASTFQAFYWEHPSMKISQLSQAYELILIDGPALQRSRPQAETFAQYFVEDQTVLSFDNLRGDAKLVVPCQLEGYSYPHLAQFVRSAPKNQIAELWKLTGQTALNLIEERKFWLSTAGLGVAWLHLRFDSRPKYYKWSDYR